MHRGSQRSERERWREMGWNVRTMGKSTWMRKRALGFWAEPSQELVNGSCQEPSNYSFKYISLSKGDLAQEILLPHMAGCSMHLSKKPCDWCIMHEQNGYIKQGRWKFDRWQSQQNSPFQKTESKAPQKDLSRLLMHLRASIRHQTTYEHDFPPHFQYGIHQKNPLRWGYPNKVMLSAIAACQDDAQQRPMVAVSQLVPELSPLRFPAARPLPLPWMERGLKPEETKHGPAITAVRVYRNQLNETYLHHE